MAVSCFLISVWRASGWEGGREGVGGHVMETESSIRRIGLKVPKAVLGPRLVRQLPRPAAAKRLI